MSNQQIITYLHHGESLPPVTKAEWLLQRITNGIYGIERDIQELHQMRLEDIRHAQIVTEDGPVVSGVQAAGNVMKYLHDLSTAGNAWVDTLRFKLMLMDRKRSRA